MEGSAQYLTDEKKWRNQSRVTFQYSATTIHRQLMVTDIHMGEEQRALIKRGEATHMVTAILYGATAFFVFDSGKLETRRVQETQVAMKGVLNKLLTVNVHGELDARMTEDEKILIKQFCCRFYGDFILDSNPTTFEDALKIYKQLPKMLSVKGENSVPLKVWLMPLKSLDPDAAELKKQISVGLMRKVQDLLEDLKEIGIKCKDLLEDTVAEKFPQIQTDLNRFWQLCDYYKSDVQRCLAQKFPLIRAGEMEEDEVEKLLKKRAESPFGHDVLNNWLIHKERKMNIIRSCVQKMDGIRIIRCQAELDREVLDPSVTDVVCYCFTSLERSDPHLNKMDRYLASPTALGAARGRWYHDNDVLTDIKKTADMFVHMYRVFKEMEHDTHRFFIVAFEQPKYKGATVHHYRNGVLVPVGTEPAAV